MNCVFVNCLFGTYRALLCDYRSLLILAIKSREPFQGLWIFLELFSLYKLEQLRLLNCDCREDHQAQVSINYPALTIPDPMSYS